MNLIHALLGLGIALTIVGFIGSIYGLVQFTDAHSDRVAASAKKVALISVMVFIAGGTLIGGAG